MLDHALKYLKMGFAPIPLCSAKDPCTNSDCKSSGHGKRPLIPWQQFQNRLPSEAEVRAWWEQYPGANIGIVTGAVSGIAVLDIDPRHGGDKSINGKNLPETPTQKTGSGGWHYFYKNAHGLRCKTGLLPGVDFRAEGGFIVVAPSIHPSGNPYEFFGGLELNRESLAEIPQWILESLNGKSNTTNGQRAPGEYAKLFQGVPQGKRNSTIAQLTGHLLLKKLPEDEILQLLLAVNQRNKPPLEDSEVVEAVRSTVRTDARNNGADKNPWLEAKDVGAFLEETDKEFQGLVKNLVAPGCMTLIAAPRGLGKTQTCHALEIALAKGGVFLGEQLRPARVLLLDRDNPLKVVRERLKAWNAAGIPPGSFKLLTRNTAPDLKDPEVWEKFPISGYDAVFIDSVGSSTEGVTEKEGRETTEIIATILDLARKGPAVLLLTNTVKDGKNIKGRGEWQDRADIIYEVRDATGVTPSGKKSWWLELPEAGEGGWAERAARRKGRVDFRLAFVPSKFRVGVEPDPFCVELHLPKNEAWSIRDVTVELIQAGEESIKKKEAEIQQKRVSATEVLLKEVEKRKDKAPVKKTEAERLLRDEGLTEKEARVLLEDPTSPWKLNQVGGGKGKQARFVLSPAHNNDNNGSQDPHKERASTAPAVVAQLGCGQQRNASEIPSVYRPIVRPHSVVAEVSDTTGDGSNNGKSAMGGASSKPIPQPSRAVRLIV